MSSRSSISLRGSDGLPLPVLGIVALTAIPLTLALGAYLAWPLRSIAASRHSVSAPPPAPKAVDTQKFKDSTLARLDQISGRSLFAIPREPKKEAAKGPKPSVYAGPQIVAMINDAVWFSDGSRIALGAAADKGLRVLRINPPWSATVEWQGGEFDVDLFKRTDLNALRDTVSKSSSFFTPGTSKLTPPPGRALGDNIPPGPGATPPAKPAEPADAKAEPPQHEPPKPESQPESRPESKPEPKPDPKPEPHSEPPPGDPPSEPAPQAKP